MTSGNEKVYTLIRPQEEKALPILIDSPHSGRMIPKGAGFLILEGQHRFYEDRDVDALMDGLTDQGVTCLMASFSRCFIDLNRTQDDVDDEWGLMGDFHPSPKAKAGFGLIRRLDQQGDLFQKPITQDEYERRLDGFYHPYHDAVAHEISRLKARFGRVLYINLHSMPSESAPMLPMDLPFASRRADIVISDRDGETADKKTRNGLVDAFEQAGFSVAINMVYHGGELIRRHAHPTKGIDAIQVEISRHLYLDEESYERNSEFKTVMTTLQDTLYSFATREAKVLVP